MFECMLVCRAGGRTRLPPPPEESREEMDIDADSEGGNDQENEAEALNIMPTEEQADFHRPAAASRCVADCCVPSFWALIALQQAVYVPCREHPHRVC